MNFILATVFVLLAAAWPVASLLLGIHMQHRLDNKYGLAKSPEVTLRASMSLLFVGYGSAALVVILLGLV